MTASKLQAIHTRIQAALARRGPGPGVRLIGVSKRHPVSAIEAFAAVGLRDFGENYAQEFRDKYRDCQAPDLRWHFIGHLQANKLKYVVGKTLIHTLDRPSLLTALQARAAREQLVQDVLVEVSLVPEANKAGITPDRVGDLLDLVGEQANVRCRGLMAIPPAGSAEQTRPHFAALRRLRDALAKKPRPGVQLEHLSMGMSSDFEVAIEEGATLVRVGTALFGPRPR